MEFFNPEKMKPELDPTMPDFRFTDEERESMRKKGMSDEQIAAKENEVQQRLAERQVEKELDEDREAA